MIRRDWLAAVTGFVGSVFSFLLPWRAKAPIAPFKWLSDHSAYCIGVVRRSLGEGRFEIEVEAAAGGTGYADGPVDRPAEGSILTATSDWLSGRDPARMLGQRVLCEFRWNNHWQLAELLDGLPQIAAPNLGRPPGCGECMGERRLAPCEDCKLAVGGFKLTARFLQGMDTNSSDFRGLIGELAWESAKRTVDERFKPDVQK